MERDPAQITLLEAARIVARGGDLDSELGALAEHVRRSTGALGVAIYLLDPVAGQLVAAAAAGIDDSALASADAIAADDEASIVARVATDRRALTGSSVPSIFAALPTAARSAIGVPLIAADATGAEETEGVLVAAFAGEAPDPEAAEDPLFALADLCAVAIRKARLTNALVQRSEWIERLASTDALTGLANRATFERMLELEIARARRQELELSVVLFDVEDFAGMNEREGRAAGDDVLRRVASLLADQVRLVDTIARLGGDEFGLIAPGGGGAIVAKRVSDAARELRTRGGAPVELRAATVVFPRDGQATDELMKVASAGLTKSGLNGRRPPLN